MLDGLDFIQAGFALDAIEFRIALLRRLRLPIGRRGAVVVVMQAGRQRARREDQSETDENLTHGEAIADCARAVKGAAAPGVRGAMA
jgi:hypothetical protein